MPAVGMQTCAVLLDTIWRRWWRRYYASCFEVSGLEPEQNNFS